MLTPKWQIKLLVALQYFVEHMSPARYYGAGSLYLGRWFGKAAIKMGLAGWVEKADFTALCNNEHPKSKEQITARQNGARRIFCDFVLSPPKSFSILALVGQDSRLVELHREAALTAAQELETFAMCRVHRGHQSFDQETGNVVGVQFTDPISRDCDPQLHDHLIFFNCTYDETSGAYRALQNSEMLKAQKFVEALYYHHLIIGLQRLGYEVLFSPSRLDFDLVGIDQTLINLFSKRHQAIQASATRLEQTKGGNIKDHAEMIAHKQREPKQKDLTRDYLLSRWKSEMTKAQLEQIQSLVTNSKNKFSHPIRQISPSAAIAWALNHTLERRAVVRDHEVLKHALHFSRGGEVKVQELRDRLANRPDVLREGRSMTTLDVLATEEKLLELANTGKGTFAPFETTFKAIPELNPEQAAALQGILACKDECQIIRGGAGTGKSTLLRHLCQALTQKTSALIVLAPQAQQARALSQDGLPNPQTLASFLKSSRLGKGAVVICDEAGQIGSVSLLKLFKVVRSNGCRLILSGDTRQHGPVERGDALRSLEKYAQVETVELNIIQRQNPAQAKSLSEAKQIDLYRESVRAIANGNIARSVQILDRLNAFKETTGNKLNQMSQVYFETLLKGESALALSQTRSEVQHLNQVIRQTLQSNGVIATDEVEVCALAPRDYTEAQKQIAGSYGDQPFLVLHSNLRCWKAGTCLSIVSTSDSGPVVATSHDQYQLSWADSAKWQVCDKRPLQLSRGDRLQLKRNQRSGRGKDNLVNGEIVVVDAVRQNGTIDLKDGRSLPAGYRTFQYGYATTSYGGQGKTVDHVLVSDSGSRAATNARQWYVDVSRGRKSVQIFTSDKPGLIKRICQSGENPLALEVFGRALPKPPRIGLRVREKLKKLAKVLVLKTRQTIQRTCQMAQAQRILLSHKGKRQTQRAVPLSTKRR